MRQKDSESRGESDQAQRVDFGAAIRYAVSSAIAGICTEAIFYGLDSYKVIKQTGGTLTLSRMFRGTVPIAVLGGGPAFGSFFLIYSISKDSLTSILGQGNDGLVVLGASLFAGIPSSICSVPADNVKKQMLLGEKYAKQHAHDPSSAHLPRATVSSTIGNIIRSGGFRKLFRGWKVNILRDVPFAAIKMSLYEGFARVYIHLKGGKGDIKIDHSGSAGDLSKYEAAGIGLLSGVTTAVITNPIDVVNTRTKSGELANLSVLKAHLSIIQKDGVTALFRGLAPRSAIIGLGATVFWYLQANVQWLLQGGQLN